MDWALILVSLVYLYLTPFTKVEESFNIQATHDILFNQWNISNYDHLEFPGVVPRTFIGPLFLSILSTPLVFLISWFGESTHLIAQYVVRAALCLCVNISLLRFKHTLQKNLGKGWGMWYLLATLSQYHFLYYSSRPLPNILAIPLILTALSAAFSTKGSKLFLISSGAAIIWFRTELALLLGIILLIQLYDSKIKIDEVLKTIIPAGIILIITTIVIDSIFWQRLVWPEAEVFYFNAILNKSSEWGTSPLLWYFYSALPRGLGTSMFLIPIGLFYESRVRRLVVAAFAFICLFSLLPHKELRFIIYTFPLLNTAVAAACHRLWENRNKSPIRWLLAVGVIGHLILNIILTVFFVSVAKVNYPGGEAMARLHELVPSEVPVFVHIDNLSAQTGVTRFTQINPNWRYSKKENLVAGSPEMLQFTHLLVEAKSKYSANLKAYKQTHNILASVEGFSELIINYQAFPVIRIKTKPLIFILERNSDVEVPELSEENESYLEVELDVDESNEEKDNYDETRESDGKTEEKSYEKDENDEKDSFEGIDDVIPDEPFNHEAPNFKESQKKDFETLSQEELVKDEPKENLKIHETLVTSMKEDKVISNPIIYEEVEDDLLAMDSKEEPQYDSSDIQSIVEDLEERLSSKESLISDEKFDDALLDSEILNDIKELTKLDFKNAQPTVEELKAALKSILNELKGNSENKNNSKEKQKHTKAKRPKEVEVKLAVDSQDNSNDKDR